MGTVRALVALPSSLDCFDQDALRRIQSGSWCFSHCGLLQYRRDKRDEGRTYWATHVAPSSSYSVTHRASKSASSDRQRKYCPLYGPSPDIWTQPRAKGDCLVKGEGGCGHIFGLFKELNFPLRA